MSRYFNDEREYPEHYHRVELWCNPSIVITGDLNEVPGIDESTIQKLATDPEQITNTHQLVGQYLLFKGRNSNGEPVTCTQVNRKFANWLKAKGVTSPDIRKTITWAFHVKVPEIFINLMDTDHIYAYSVDKFEFDDDEE